ncbi:N-acetylmuramoyl-L-alanine amidase family protein [Flammeovirga kamogawensis]|uniref:N-acetylmuramoyl-L-alanine amidase n=1 Tax=Flammeovirga kamogawensis TaxID=373891 RepID=A0ABX8GVV6_9BACT|nr:N-acetylmuramoyl-L-alanine amidase [Flammeovirga kamogawensis]MBB6460960.1 N-acetylmuramoyl-L-alanine amidase [Flammeovirga kamogawensis]QWG07533.1 N-acetylmuramoyl-L-alanine amidase [Flammeovirga kamogawensis]TRX69345.1 N-acetylmuramoyl-L-alanine amidase [Flammeovirga kamogawensis]
MKKIVHKTSIILLLFIITVSFVEAQNHKKKFIVVIDPGHGGKDPGKPRGVAKHNHEKDLNLVIAQQLGKQIRDNMIDVQVYYTRTSDVYVSLDDRVKFAEIAEADYFISVHSNSNPNKWIIGSKIHIDTNSDYVGRALATNILDTIERTTPLKSRGIMNKEDRGYNLYVLKHSTMPSILIECGFLSNKYESQYLNSEKGQTEIAKAIYSGFYSFHRSVYTPSTIDKDAYSIQILATNKKVSNTNPQFKKLANAGLSIQEHHFIRNNKSIYKYTVGNENSSYSAQNLKKRIRGLGFKDAFVVSIKK